VFEIDNDDNGVERVCGIRDYYTQMAYWAYPFKYSASKYPNRILIYNYLNGAWATFEDSITAFGYYQSSAGQTWNAWINTWAESVAPWDSGEEERKFRNVIAGNQQGYTFLIHPDYIGNAQALQITQIAAAGPVGTVSLTIYDHNLADNSYIQIQNVYGIVGLNDNIYKVSCISANEIWILEPNYIGSYSGGGTVEIVSNIDIKTKEYNFYLDKGRNAYISKVDFYVDRTSNGQVTVNCFIGNSNYNLTASGQATGALMGTLGTLETSPYALVPFEAQMDQLWHPVYPQMDGETIQLQITMSDAQITDPLIAFADFQMHAMTFYVTPTASRLQ
jgi:hypothetical protein